MDKWLNLNKNCNDADDNATNSPQADTVLKNRHLMCEKENSRFFNLALHFKIVRVMNNLFV